LGEGYVLQRKYGEHLKRDVWGKGTKMNRKEKGDMKNNYKKTVTRGGKMILFRGRNESKEVISHLSQRRRKR